MSTWWLPSVTLAWCRCTLGFGPRCPFSVVGAFLGRFACPGLACHALVCWVLGPCDQAALLLGTGLGSDRAVIQPSCPSLVLGHTLAGLSYAQPCFIASYSVACECLCVL